VDWIETTVAQRPNQERGVIVTVRDYEDLQRPVHGLRAGVGSEALGDAAPKLDRRTASPPSLRFAGSRVRVFVPE
jgi:hypothetical protein